MTSVLEPRHKTNVGNYFISNYPPYSCWKSEFIPQFEKTLASAPAEDVPLGLYMHIPFCRHRCHYCYFRVYAGRLAEDVDTYVNALLRELGTYARQPSLEHRSPSSVYFGGGSPSYMSNHQIERLFAGLRNQVSWDKVKECTFECDPATSPPDKLKLLKELGVTRLTLGFQSLNPEVMKLCGRNVQPIDCLRTYDAARAGFEEINVDLLAGLPGETDSTWADTVRAVQLLQPDCVTVYQLELTHNSGFNRMLQAGRELQFASWPKKRHWVAKAFDALEEHGYQVVSGYMAVRNPEKWKFIHIVEHFWHGSDLLGLGESAFGHLQGVHYT